MSGSIPEALADLFEAARAVRERAYAPYSKFLVGAAVRSESGAIFAGCNVENAAYPVGTCAEAGAISAMIAAGQARIVEAMVLGDGAGLVTPCGACRQRLREFGERTTPIHIADPRGVKASFTLEALLPSSFGPQQLSGVAE